jgi:3-methylfumaryl-CoA hydratase
MSHVDLQAWIGRTESAYDTIEATPVRALAATLGDSSVEVESGYALPPLWHWLYCLSLPSATELEADGSARGSGFRPPIPLPRRMWAGSRFDFFQPLRAGDRIVRTSTITGIEEKSGRSSRLVFLTICHQWRCNGAAAPAIVEHQEIVYRDVAQPGAKQSVAQEAPANAQWSRTVVPDSVLLFRYSALTFNSHRIHYDRRYAIEIEGYLGLVVQGPLLATMMLELLRRERPHSEVASFRFRAQQPVFDLHPFVVCGAPAGNGSEIHLWVQDGNGALAMDGIATLR